MADKDKELELPVAETDDGGFEVDLSDGKASAEPERQQPPVPDFTRDAAIVRAAVEGARIKSEPQSKSGDDELTSREKAIHEQQKSLGVEFEVLRSSKQLTVAKAEEYDQKARRLQQDLSEIAAQRAVRSVIPQLLQAQEEKHYQTVYADVHSNPQALRYAKGRFDMLAAQGHAPSQALVDRSMNEARIAFGMAPGKTAPTDSDRARYTGVSASASTRGGAPRVRLGKAEQAMAMAMYGDKVKGDEKAAYRLWAKGPGAKALKELNSRGNR